MPIIVEHGNHAQTPKGALGMSAISAGNALLVWWIAIRDSLTRVLSSFELDQVGFCIKLSLTHSLRINNRF